MPDQPSWSTRHGGGTITISGATAVGATVNVHGAPSGATLQWNRAGAAINGATGRAYTVQSADQGHDLTCTVTGLSNALSVPAAPLGSIPQLPLISRGNLAGASNDFGGINAAANAVDADYGSQWRSVVSPNGGTAQWLAIDLRAISAANKTNVLCVIKTPTSPTLVPAPATLGGDAASLYTSQPRNFTLDKHPSTGALPADNDAGWVTLATITDNRWAHIARRGLDLHDAGYFRVRVTGANGVTGATDDVNLTVDLRNAANGTRDWFVFFGDSITTEATRGRNVDNTAWPAGQGPLENMIETLTGRPAPVITDASTPGWRADLGAPAVATYLDPFQGAGFCILEFGANDANAAGADITAQGPDGAYATTYKTNMQTIIDHAVSLGMTVIVPHILTGNSVAWSAPNRAVLNAAIDELVSANPGSVIAGPDMSTFPAGELRDGLHPKFDTPGQGYATWHTDYVNYIAALYAA